jgi:hypothetical protein
LNKFIIVVGIFELIHLGTFTEKSENKSLSPFANDKIQFFFPFTIEEENELFNQFIEQENLDVEQGLIEEIHSYSSG